MTLLGLNSDSGARRRGGQPCVCSPPANLLFRDGGSLEPRIPRVNGRGLPFPRPSQALFRPHFQEPFTRASD
jgi:hypothetical protein